jgi:hypothetical protein
MDGFSGRIFGWFFHPYMAGNPSHVYGWLFHPKWVVLPAVSFAFWV